MEPFAAAVHQRLVGGMDDQMGWSLSHMAGIFARLGDGENACICIQQLASRFLELNFFSFCNPGRMAMNLWEMPT